MRIHREATRAAGMAVHRANDLAEQLALMVHANDLPPWLVELTIERITAYTAALNVQIDALHGALGRPSETAVWPKTHRALADMLNGDA